MSTADNQYAEAKKVLDEAREQFEQARLKVQQQILAAIEEYDKQYTSMRESLSQATHSVFSEARVVYQMGDLFSGFKTRPPVTKKKRAKTSRKKRSRVSGASKRNNCTNEPG